MEFLLLSYPLYNKNKFGHDLKLSFITFLHTVMFCLERYEPVQNVQVVEQSFFHGQHEREKIL